MSSRKPKDVAQAVPSEPVPSFVLPADQQPEPEVPSNPAMPYQFRVRTVKGDFIFRMSTVVDDIRVEKLAEEIFDGPLPLFDPGHPIPVHVTVARMLAEMKTVCDSAPGGWDWLRIRSSDRVFEMWGAYRRSASKFLEVVGSD